MTPLLDAIVAKFASASLATTGGITGGLHFDKVQDGKAPPFAVLTVIGAPLLDGYGFTHSYDAQLQFMIIGRGMKATGLLMANLVAAYDHATLTLSAGTNIGMRRTSEPFPMLQPADADLALDEQSRRLWGWYVDYEYSVQ